MLKITKQIIEDAVSNHSVTNTTLIAYVVSGLITLHVGQRKLYNLVQLL